jgi:hypothetical protein
MALGVEGEPTEAARRSPGGHELTRPVHEGRHLGTVEPHLHRRPLLGVLLHELLQHDDDPVARLVVGDADGADGPPSRAWR